MNRSRILLVDDDRAFRISTAALLKEDGHDVVAVGTGQEGADALAGGIFDLLLLDLRMPGLDGGALVQVLRARGENLPILMISGYGTVDAAVEALHLGADDFLTKPVEPAVLSDRVASLLERRPNPGADGGRPAGGLIGRSPALRMVHEAVALVAPTEATVLVTGETGTGKELVARAIHELSAHGAGPFLAVNCAALADGLLETELFGHVRGAFTGAHRDKIGLFEAARGGTLFLDEIGDVSPAMQHRLLRALQEKEVIPVGAVRPVKLATRVVAATNRDLRADAAAGRFREDLFYRLNVFRIELPPLRERRSDIPLLAAHFLEQAATRLGGGSLACTPLAMRLLQAYDWPGNVRELLTALEGAAIRAAGNRIGAEHLPPEIRATLRTGPTERYHREVEELDERRRILAALEEAGGVRTRAAELLGMGRTTLWRKLREYGIGPAPVE